MRDLATDISLISGFGPGLDQDWVSPSSLRSIVLDDPVQAWLAKWGDCFGFRRDSTDYSFFEFICRKGREFEATWVREMCPPGTEPVCKEHGNVRDYRYVLKTLDLIERGVDVIYQGVLWHPGERLYGMPDLIARLSWLRRTFPTLEIRDSGNDYYIVDLKFTTKLDDGRKDDDLEYACCQVRTYTYMLAQVQSRVPNIGLLITRDHIFEPITVPIFSKLGKPLDRDLAEYRDAYLEIQKHGLDHLPWQDEWLKPNLRMTRDEPWHGAKREIAERMLVGEPVEKLYAIRQTVIEELGEKGLRSFQDLLEVDPKDLPLGQTPTAEIQRAILRAHQTGKASPVDKEVVPKRKRVELFVDFEFMNNLNVDMDREFPKLGGNPMLFMIGCGWEEHGKWKHEILVADSETGAGEKKLLREFHRLLTERGVFDDPQHAAVYCWTMTEKREMKGALERRNVPCADELSTIPWVDLRQPFVDGPIALPGATNMRLKSVTTALREYNPTFGVAWPGDMCDGLRAMVAGWEMYKSPKPRATAEYDLLSQYLESDIEALWMILKWLRSSARQDSSDG